MTNDDKKTQPKNYLMSKQAPDIKSSQFYDKQKSPKKDYGEIWGTETHSRRRKLIMQSHPEVSQLLKPSKPYSLYIAVFLILLGLTTCYLVKDASWPVFLFVTYWLGGTIGHSLHVVIHDLTHWAGHPNISINKFFAIMCNIPMGLPSAMSFAKHHSDHHNFLGETNKDPDLPLKIESEASKKSFLYKLFFWVFLTAFYALRPLINSPNAKFTTGQTINFLFIFTTNFLIYKLWGINAILYLLIIAFISIGPHPAAIHAIAEHYEIVPGQETYNYFGIWNFFNLNLGYHIEHHDFPTCPWYNLPKIRRIAPQFYEHLPYHTSYIKLLGKFLFDINFNLYNRTVRHTIKQE